MDNENTKQGGYGKRPLWQWALIYVVIALVLYGGFYYFVLSKNSSSPYSTTTQQTASPTTSVNATQAPSANAQQVTISGTEFSFTPSTFTVKANQPVEVTFKNTGAFPHNFTIADLNVKSETIQPGGQTTVTFTPTKTGKFTFICSVPGHADKGMTGTLTVE